MENFDIFNLSLDDFKTEEKTSRGSSEYKTDPKQSKDSIYRSIVRFLPNVKNPKKSIIRKYSYWLEDETGSGFYADCPSSIPGEKSVIQDTFWKLFKSESAFEKKQAERMKRKEYHYAYVLIVKDPQRPELENTVQIARFPKVIRKMIDAQVQPSAEDIEMGIEPTNIFDFFNGKDFSFKVTLKGGYWNYDECKFNQANTPISINGVKMDNNEDGRKMIMGLYDNLPGVIEDNEFKPWTSELQDKVFDYLKNLTGSNPGAAYQAVTSPNKPVEKTETPVKSENLNTASNEASKSSDDEIESWLNEFEV